MDDGVEVLTTLKTPKPPASCAMQSTFTQCLSSSHMILLVHPCRQQPRMRIRQHARCRIQSFNAPSCTQKPPCLHLKTCTGSLASYSLFTLLSVSIKRKFCTSSADGTPGHGNHDMGPHGLNERDGAVDGLGPAVISLVALPDYEISQTYPDTLQLCSRLALRSSRSGNCQR
jgi:hypothetical protein